MGAKAWSKATPEQREKHRQSCKEAGKLRKIYNLIDNVCESARKKNIDGIDYLNVWTLILKNKKYPFKDNKGQQIIDLLKKKIKPEKVYKMIFEI